MNGIFSKFKQFITKGDTRSISVKKNIVISIMLKLISIIISLQIVPLTIDYLDPTRYGIWLTLSSIVAWLAYFDLGFTNGFRNKFAEARSKGDSKLAKAYVSTAYFSLTLIFSCILIIALVVNRHLNWCEILNISLISNSEFRAIFSILACCFCCNIVVNIFSMVLTADQRPAIANTISTLGQVLSFVSILILLKFSKGSLINMALFFSCVPCLIWLTVSLIAYKFSKYREIAPSFNFIQLSLVKNIIGLGSQFFFIMISMLFIYQFINIILTRVEGPYVVTQYNVAYKYFNVVFMCVVIILNPFWSATTDAYIKNDFDWMKRVVKKLELLWLCCIPVVLVMILCANTMYKWWLGVSVTVPISISISVAIYIICQLAGNIYMYIINGTGKVRVQLLIYVIFALFSIPAMSYLCKILGVSGILILPTFVYAIQAFCGKIQIKKLINKDAYGLWNK